MKRRKRPGRKKGKILMEEDTRSRSSPTFESDGRKAYRLVQEGVVALPTCLRAGKAADLSVLLRALQSDQAE